MQHYNPLAYILALAWVPFCMAIFLSFRPVRALFIVAVGGFLFLPQFSIDSHFVPYNKETMIPLAMLAGVLIGDIGALKRLRLGWIDLPVVVFTIVPLASGLHNGFSPYDSAAAAASNFVAYGIPYFLGRIYLRDSATIWRFAMAMFFAALIYLPFCLFEMHFGPWFHEKLYGGPAFPDYSQSIRDGGFRPIVFMQHGLMLGMMMAAGALCAIWLWACQALPRTIAYVPSGIWALALAVATVLCHSSGATILLAVGLGVLLVTRRLHSYLPVLVLAALPVAYMTARAGFHWSGENLVSFVGKYASSDRAASLETRLENETRLVNKAMEKPWLGWGPKGNQQIANIDDKTVLGAIPDGMWEWHLGAWGLVGLAGAYGMLLLPTLALLWRFPRQAWGHPALAAPEVLAVICLLYAVDNLFNNMVNPLFYLAMGAVASAAMTPRDSVPRAVAVES